MCVRKNLINKCIDKFISKNLTKDIYKFRSYSLATYLNGLSDKQVQDFYNDANNKIGFQWLG